MSQIIEIHTKRVIDSNDLYHFLQGRMELLQGVQKSDAGYYFYQDKTSIRGVDFWKAAYGYELRITILASLSDRKIASWILIYVINFVPDAKYFVEEEPVKSKDIVSCLEKNSFSDDATLLKTLVEHNDSTITLFGPKGEFYIGSSVLQKIESHKEGWQERLQALILKVQYELPPSESDTVLESGEDENKKIFKLVNREVSYVLKKYDYLIFIKDETVSTFENMVFITNEILNQNLPKTWELIDDYTIFAPALSNEEYDMLLEKLMGFDCSGELERG